MSEFIPDPQQNKYELLTRHMLELGIKYGQFLNEQRNIDPNFADVLTDEQEAEFARYSSDMRITHEIEKHELL